MKKEQETSEEKNEEIADSTDKTTAPSTAFPDLTEKHPCPHRYCALLEELKTTPDLYDLLHSYCTFPESLDNLYGTPLAHLRCDWPVRPRADTAAPTPRIPLETDKEVPCLAPARISQKKEKSRETKPFLKNY